MMDKKNGISSFLLQDYLESILDHFHDGIYITDKEANTVYLNHSYELISGLQKSEMLGKNMRELVERGVVSRSGTLELLESKADNITTQQSFRTGKRAIITSTPIYEEGTDNKNIIMVVTIVREITEIYSIRKELRRKEELNRKYLNEVERIRNEMDGNIEIVAADSKSISLMRLAQKVALVDEPVFISGENGVGKEKLADFIHKHSKRLECSFVPVNFSILPRENSLDYLLGYTDAKSNEYRMGLLESAEHGTLYIEELADIPSELQGLILTLLKAGSSVMGDGAVHKWNVRVIAGSRYTLSQLADQNKINQEILESFSLFPLEIEPLRERKEDIVPLLHFFLNQYNHKTGENKKFDRESYSVLLAYHWPGNVRELQNLVQRAAIISPHEMISPQDLFMEDNIEYVSHQQEELLEKRDLREEVAKLEAEFMERAFLKYHNIRSAAESLGMDSSTFVRKRQRYVQMGLMKKTKENRKRK